MNKILILVFGLMSFVVNAKQPELYAQKNQGQLLDQLIVGDKTKNVKVRLLQDVVDPKNGKIILKRDDTMDLDVSGVDRLKGEVSLYAHKNDLILSGVLRGAYYSSKGEFLSGVNPASELDDLFVLNMPQYLHSNPILKNFVYIPQGTLLDLNW